MKKVASCFKKESSRAPCSVRESVMMDPSILADLSLDHQLLDKNCQLQDRSTSCETSIRKARAKGMDTGQFGNQIARVRGEFSAAMKRRLGSSANLNPRRFYKILEMWINSPSIPYKYIPKSRHLPVQYNSQIALAATCTKF